MRSKKEDKTSKGIATLISLHLRFCEIIIDDRLKVVLREMAEENGCHIDTMEYPEIWKEFLALDIPEK